VTDVLLFIYLFMTKLLANRFVFAFKRTTSEFSSY